MIPAKQAQHRLNEAGVGPIAEDGDFGPASYTALFRFMGARAAALDLGEAAALLFPKYAITSPLRVAHWLAQFGHESSGFTRFEEGLSYSAARLRQVWPKRFPTLDVANEYAHNPQKLAEKVYGGRMGNTKPGDGWKYRGRGPQLTGYANYKACEVRTGLPLTTNPDLASLPENFVLIACDFWQASSCNLLADRDALEEITIRINGGRIGITERRKQLFRAKGILEP